METTNPYSRTGNAPEVPKSKKSFNGRIFAGLVIVTVGSVLLIDKLGLDVPRWVLSWPMLLIAIGFYAGFKHNFKGIGWLIMIAVGGVFLADRLIYAFDIYRLFWPIAIISIGLYIMFRPKKKDPFLDELGMSSSSWGNLTSDAKENYIEATAIFGGVKKNVITKEFRGGEVTSIFGGSEILLTQADFNGRVTLEVTAIFGGSKIIVPSNWQVNADEVTAILGSVDDKRINTSPTDPNKVLIIKGVAIFGGIELVSF